MIEVVVVGEGQTEETFIRDVMAPVLWGFNVSLQPRLIRTSSHGRGGALTRMRVVRFLRNTLRERKDTYVTTLFDLYGLVTDFPGVRECAGIVDPLQRTAAIESHLGDVVVKEAECRADRFLPYIQPHEFESLLFTDIASIADVESSWAVATANLNQALSTNSNPEYINDGPITHPSVRLKALTAPTYQKTLHGPRIAAHIGLTRIRQKCAHFAGWIDQLEQLTPLQP
ncbi:MAG: DUF4276 family protein [Thermomicrobiales bacterium]